MDVKKLNKGKVDKPKDKPKPASPPAKTILHNAYRGKRDAPDN